MEVDLDHIEAGALVVRRDGEDALSQFVVRQAISLSRRASRHQEQDEDVDADVHAPVLGNRIEDAMGALEAVAGHGGHVIAVVARDSDRSGPTEAATKVAMSQTGRDPNRRA